MMDVTPRFAHFEPKPEPEPEPAPAPVPEAHDETQAELEARIAAIPRDRSYTNIFAAEKAAAAATAQSQTQPTTRGKSDGHDSDLSSLSELESEEEGGREEVPKERPAMVRLPAPPIAGPSTVPQPPGPGAVVLPEESRLLLLGEDNALDAEMLAPTSRRQRWKTASIRKDCRDAFARAIAEMETDADMVAEPDAIGTGMEGIVVEHMTTDPNLVGPENTPEGTQPDAMETDNRNMTAEGGSNAQLAAPAGSNG